MRRGRQRGIALVLVTWVFMILGVLALDFARYMRDDAVASLNLAQETRNYYVAVAAMNLAIYDLQQGETAKGHVDVTPERRTLLASRADAPLARCAGGACARRAKDDEEDDDEEDDREGATDGSSDEDDEEGGLASADGEWHEDVLDNVRYGVRVIDEGGLISLNDAAQEAGAPLLRHVIKTLMGYGGAAGMDRRGDEAVATVVDSIVDWYDRDDEVGVHGAESRFYLAREPSYPAKNADFDSLEELLQVRGVTPELYYGSGGMPGLKNVFSPYVHARGEHPKVNLNHVPAPVLQALLGIDAEEAAALLDVREEQDLTAFKTEVMNRMQNLDPTLAAQIFTEKGASKVVRIEARADVTQPRNQARVAAVVELDNDNSEGVRIIRWFDRAPWEGGLPAGTGDGPA